MRSDDGWYAGIIEYYGEGRSSHPTCDDFQRAHRRSPDNIVRYDDGDVMPYTMEDARTVTDSDHHTPTYLKRRI